MAMNLESSVGRIETSIFLNFAAMEELLHAFDDIFGTRHTIAIDRTLASICRDVTELLRQISGSGRNKKLKISGMKYNRSPPRTKNTQRQNKKYIGNRVQLIHFENLENIVRRRNKANLWNSFRAWKDLSDKKRLEEQEKRVARHNAEISQEVAKNYRKDMQSLEAIDYRECNDSDDILRHDGEGRVVYESVSAGRENIRNMLTSPLRRDRREERQGHVSDTESDQHEHYLSSWLQQKDQVPSMEEEVAIMHLSDEMHPGDLEFHSREDTSHADTLRPDNSKVDLFDRIREITSPENELEVGYAGSGSGSHGMLREGNAPIEMSFSLADGEEATTPYEYTESPVEKRSSVAMVFNPDVQYDEEAEEVVFGEDEDVHSEDVADYDGIVTGERGEGLNKSLVDASTDTSMDGIVISTNPAIPATETIEEENDSKPPRRLSAADFLFSVDELTEDNKSRDAEQEGRNDIVNKIDTTTEKERPNQHSARAREFIQNSEVKRASRRNTYLSGSSCASSKSEFPSKLSSAKSSFVDDQSISYREIPSWDRTKTSTKHKNDVGSVSDSQNLSGASISTRDSSPEEAEEILLEVDDVRKTAIIESTYPSHEVVNQEFVGGNYTPPMSDINTESANGSRAMEFIQKNSEAKRSSRRNTYLPVSSSSSSKFDVKPTFSDDQSIFNGTSSNLDHKRDGKVDLALFAYTQQSSNTQQHSVDVSDDADVVKSVKKSEVGGSSLFDLPSLQEDDEDDFSRDGFINEDIIFKSTKIENGEYPDTESEPHLTTAVSNPSVVDHLEMVTDRSQEVRFRKPMRSEHSAYPELSSSQRSVPSYRRQSMSDVSNSSNGASGGNMLFSGAKSFSSFDTRLSDSASQSSSKIGLSEKPPRPRRASVMVSRGQLPAPPPPKGTMSPIESTPSSGQSTPSRRRTPPLPPSHEY